ncbi:MAG TPA: Gfo/Idh/MocA family oxidoreductase [Bryobacteraceae bacterium]|nr:Gfo/Idh/MocA family oxidoreductase [Bryobacteraceae bacterium]
MQASRRTFLAAAATAASAARVSGANDRLRVGVIGNGGRGQYLMKELNRTGDVDIVAVCDVYNVRRDAAATIAGGSVKQYGDHRRVLDHKDIDAVIVATPDHWHGPITVDACNAGKDVYVEKPMVHTPRDGQAVVNAARRNKRIVQVGMQGRGLPQFLTIKQKYVDSGVIGKVGMARTWYTSNRGYIQKPPEGMGRKPEGLDWDRWLGPGPKVAWNPDVYFSPYKWLHYDGGMIMGIGIHVVDSAHHLLKLHNPRAAVCGGGIYHYKDGRDTPDVVSFILDYPEEVTVTFAAEVLTAPGVRTTAGVELRGTGGTVMAERYVQDIGWEYVPNTAVSKAPAEKGPGDPRINAGPMIANWLECIRTRQAPVANEVEGYYSAMACFMALEAYRTESRIAWKKEWAV